MKIGSLFSRMISTMLGAAIGLVAGYAIFGVLQSVILDLIFGWRDTGPEWVNWVIFTGTGISVIIGIYLFNKR